MDTVSDDTIVEALRARQEAALRESAEHKRQAVALDREISALRTTLRFYQKGKDGATVGRPRKQKSTTGRNLGPRPLKTVSGQSEKVKCSCGRSFEERQKFNRHVGQQHRSHPDSTHVEIFQATQAD